MKRPDTSTPHSTKREENLCAYIEQAEAQVRELREALRRIVNASPSTYAEIAEAALVPANEETKE